MWRYEEKTFTHYTAADGLAAGTVISLQTIPAGSLVAGMRTNGTLSFDGTRFKIISVAISLLGMVPGPDGLSWAAFASPAGDPGGIVRSAQMLVLGGAATSVIGPGGIARLSGDRIVSVITNFPGLRGNRISSLGRAIDGAVWAGSLNGSVIRFEGSNGVPTLVETNGLMANAIYPIHCDPRGMVWIGAFGGIAQFDGTRWKEFTQTNGAPERYVNAIESRPDGSIWFGSTDGGLARFDGQTMGPVARGSEKFVPSSVTKICRSADGNLWFATHTGVTRYDGVTWSPLDEGDGLLTGSVDSIAQDRNGVMWFGGERGLTRYQPALLTTRTPTVTVQTDLVYTNLQPLPHVTAGRLVTFKCNCVDFRTRPEKRLYRYAIVPGRVATAPEKTDARWQPATRDAQFSWPPNCEVNIPSSPNRSTET
ncbi:MAG: hypothetical protein EXS36_16900 [Pedosphaera sp.]|nr:hypothetical protein [Pedosphaera sp.]